MNVEQFVAKALKYEGYPSILYKGFNYGKDESGFDCSGFIYFLLEQFNMANPKIRHCNEYFDFFGILIHYGLHKKGDLVFFSKNGMCPTHVGIMISGTKYIHSPGKDKTEIKTKTLKKKAITPKIQNNNTKYELIYKTNPIGFKRIALRNGRYQQLL
jgi:cell wall-associated NlpC family hydrolase